MISMTLFWVEKMLTERSLKSKGIIGTIDSNRGMMWKICKRADLVPASEWIGLKNIIKINLWFFSVVEVVYFSACQKILFSQICSLFSLFGKIFLITESINKSTPKVEEDITDLMNRYEEQYQEGMSRYKSKNCGKQVHTFCWACVLTFVW